MTLQLRKRIRQMKVNNEKCICFLCGKETKESENGLCSDCEKKLEYKKNERKYLEQLEK